MPVKNQKYAFVTVEGWERSLSERWPGAPLIDSYRLLVFANEDLPKLEEEYASTDFQTLGVEGTIAVMEDNQVGPFICSQTEAREVVVYFTPPYEGEERVEDKDNA